VDDLPELDGAKLCFENGDYCSATSLSWASVTRALAAVRNRYLTSEDLAGICITDDSQQSTVYRLLVIKLAAVGEDVESEIDRLLIQQRKANLELADISEDYAKEALNRAESVITAIKSLDAL
jgi:hypothetical protein